MSNPYITAPIHARMYATTAHKVIWVVVVAASAGLLAPPLFYIAAKKRAISMLVPVVYAVIIYGSASLGSLVGNPKNWVGGVLAITMIVASVHAAILDTDWKPGR
ncbi:hypothetical protein ABZT28_56265 [Streptomyces sp. NPDC005388]|uniref:hypothetical protein n=1 Tax=Streptomyces sp. NPDC005388 TaxID=3156717 RepID=UPI0033A7F2F3